MSDEVIWITRDPAPVLDGRDVEITFTSKVRECTYRMPRARARRVANAILAKLDAAEPKANNVQSIKSGEHS
jgi:hypothetical protein